MTRTALVVAALLTLCAPLVARAQEAPAPETTVLLCGRLIDTPGKATKRGATIVVVDGRITDVTNGLAPNIAGPDATVIDLTDHTVLPGLIDCHTHITGQYTRSVRLRRLVETDADAAIKGVLYADRTVRAGFTTIRNVGSAGDAAFALRDAIDDGLVAGPRILVAGESISPTGGHSDGTLGYREDLFAMPGAMQGIADGADACRQAVRAQVKRGADLIKLTATGGVLSNTAAGVEQQFFEDELRAVVETGHLLGRKVAAHAHGATGIKAALKAGVDSVEHGTYLDDECIDLFRQTGAFLVPTIHAGKFVELKATEDGYFPGPVREKASAVGPIIQGAFERAHKAGVRIAFGTDVGVGEHGTNALEFVYMAEAGMSPSDCLVSATIHAAELCDLADEIGTIEPGKAADIIAVRGDPTRDVSVLQRVPFVMARGRIVAQPEREDEDE